MMFMPAALAAVSFCETARHTIVRRELEQSLAFSVHRLFRHNPLILPLFLFFASLLYPECRHLYYCPYLTHYYHCLSLSLSFCSLEPSHVCCLCCVWRSSRDRNKWREREVYDSTQFASFVFLSVLLGYFLCFVYTDWSCV